MDVHLGQRQLQGTLGAGASLQALRVEPALTHLGDGDGDLPQARCQRLVFVAVGVARAPFGALVQSRAQVVLALDLHGSIEQDAEKIGQRIQAVRRELLQKRRRQSRIVVVGHG